MLQDVNHVCGIPINGFCVGYKMVNRVVYKLICSIWPPIPETRSAWRIIKPIVNFGNVYDN